MNLFHNKLKAKTLRLKQSDVQEDLIITVTDNETKQQVCRLVVKKIGQGYKTCLERGEA